MVAVLVLAFTGSANLSTDDTGILAGILLVVSGAYGFVLGPRWAWAAGCFFAAAVPLSQLLSVALPIHARFAGPVTPPAVILPLVFALVGAYLGAGLRRLAQE